MDGRPYKKLWSPNPKKVYHHDCIQYFSQHITPSLIARMTADAMQPMPTVTKTFGVDAILSDVAKRREREVREQLLECVAFAKAEHVRIIREASPTVLALGTHPRVGAASPIRLLDDLIIGMIIDAIQ